MIRILILGANGSMGQLVGKSVLDDPEIELIGAFDINNIGKNYPRLIGSPIMKEILVEDIKNLEPFIKFNKPDIAVDFTTAEATERNCLVLVKNGIRTIIGTTGLSEKFLKEFESLVIEKKVPSIISPNMATGMNIFFKMASILTSYLEDWDIEIIESHHHRKRDSPSGTALTIAHIIANTLGVRLEDVAKYGRDKGPNKRKLGAKKEIGIHAIRAGDIVGEHTILFAGLGERIELKHIAHSRDSLANGAIQAIKYLHNVEKDNAKIFSTQEVLGLVE